MKAYFAYGSNMDPKQMDQRCPGAVPLGPALLQDHELRFTYDSPSWGGGVATVDRAPGREVWGVVWDLTDEHIAALDVYEGVAEQVYIRTTATVSLQGAPIEALIYISQKTGVKAPSARYVSALVRGAKVYGLPNEYVRMLMSLSPRGPRSDLPQK